MLPNFSSLRTAEEYDAAIASRLQESPSQHTEQELRVIRSRRNDNIPAIARLHNEILAEIFSLLMEACRRAYNPVTCKVSAWIYASHVCRLWRDVALEHAPLWASSITLQNDMDRLQVFLRRSKQAALVVSSLASAKRYFADELHPNILRTLQPHASRIRSLKLIVTDRLMASLENSPPLDAPNLKRLDVALTGIPFVSFRTVTGLWFLSKASMAELQILNIANLQPGLFRTLIRPSLTQLTVSRSTLSIDEWVKVLMQTPSLQLLSLDASISLAIDPLAVSWATVALHKLRKLVLSGCSQRGAYARLLTHLDVRASCRIHLLECDSHEHTLLFSAIATKLSNACSTHALRACVIDASPHAVSIEFWQNPDDVMQHRLPYTPDWDLASLLTGITHVQPHLHLSLSFPLAHSGEHLLASCMSHLPLDTVDALFVHGHNLKHTRLDGSLIAEQHALEEVGTRFLNVMYTPFRHVQHLHCQAPPRVLLRTLAQSAPRTPTATVEYPIFPKLQHLTLHSLKWHAHGARCSPAYGWKTPLKNVKAALVGRRGMGLPLASVRLQNLWNIAPRDRTILRRAMEAEHALGWDGRDELQETLCSVCPPIVQFLHDHVPNLTVREPSVHGSPFGDGDPDYGHGQSAREFSVSQVEYGAFIVLHPVQ